MFDQLILGREFFELLEQGDQVVVALASAEPCAACGGRLHRGDYDRKPRGGLFGRAGETSVRRFSLCCGDDGCRKRATPPSLRFLGRRVYVGAVVILVSIVAEALVAAGEIRARTGVPARTARRWLSWWRGPFLGTEVFAWLRARLIGVATATVPASIVERFEGSMKDQVRTMLGFLAPLSTGSVGDGSRFLRGVAGAA